jgi:hypothetical protein
MRKCSLPLFWNQPEFEFPDSSNYTLMNLNTTCLPWKVWLDKLKREKQSRSEYRKHPSDYSPDAEIAKRAISIIIQTSTLFTKILED